MEKKEELAELRGIAKILDILWYNSANERNMDERVLVEIKHYFGENWTKDMYEFAGIIGATHEMPRTLKELNPTPH